MHVQNATLAGGVAVGSAAALSLHPAGALAIGAFAGALSTVGFAFALPGLEAKIGLGDTVRGAAVWAGSGAGSGAGFARSAFRA